MHIAQRLGEIVAERQTLVRQVVNQRQP